MAGAVAATDRDALNEQPGYLTVRETAQRLNMHFMSVYKLVQSGRLPALKHGSRWKIDPTELERWLEQRQGVRRQWLLVGGDDAYAQRLASGAGPRRRIERCGFDELTWALAGAPPGVLLDTATDWHAAMAALAVCREHDPAPFCALLVEQPSAARIAEALTSGPVNLLPRRLPPEVLDVLETSLGWA